jgi:AmmeMemoRadiSam system protein B
LAVRCGIQLSLPSITQLLQALDESYLLENETYFQACARVLDDYQSAAYRPPASAGLSYPDDPDELRQLLDGYLAELPAAPPPHNDVCGLISPHIDYARGGPTYARVWERAQGAAKNAELVLILGTDHSGKAGSLTLTRQHYATPYGVLPTAVDVIDDLAKALGEQAAFAEELHHRAEHSIELAAVWLHHIRGGEPCQVVPILCGSFDHYVRGKEVAQAAHLNQALHVLRDAVQTHRTLVVAAADLAHVGPAFGGLPLDAAGRAELQAADEALIAQISAGSATGFIDEVRRAQDRYNVCGIPPIYLMLRLLEPARGELLSYGLCPADERGTSQVSICGVTFTDQSQ